MNDEHLPQRLFTTIQWLILLVCTLSPVVGFALLARGGGSLGETLHIGLSNYQAVWFTLAAVMGMVAAVILAGRMLLAARPVLLLLVILTVVLGLFGGLLLQSAQPRPICAETSPIGFGGTAGFPYAWVERAESSTDCGPWQVVLPGLAVDILFWFNLGVVGMVLVTLIVDRQGIGFEG